MEGQGVAQSAETVKGIWALYIIVPCIATVIAVVFLLIFYKLKSKDAEIMSKVNRGEMTHDEAGSLLSREY